MPRRSQVPRERRHGQGRLIEASGPLGPMSTPSAYHSAYPRPSPALLGPRPLRPALGAAPGPLVKPPGASRGPLGPFLGICGARRSFGLSRLDLAGPRCIFGFFFGSPPRALLGSVLRGRRIQFSEFLEAPPRFSSGGARDRGGPRGLPEGLP
eukprot:3862682-Pyramimonas_sp.AAC.1